MLAFDLVEADIGNTSYNILTASYIRKDNIKASSWEKQILNRALRVSRTRKMKIMQRTR
jgi:hypothetical protein